MYNTNFEKLVCSRQISEKLKAMGVFPAASLHWISEDEESPLDTWRVVKLHNPGEDSLAAWTMEELRIMIGNRYAAPDLSEPRPRPMPGEETQFIVAYLHTSETYESGAEALANYLLFLLQGVNLTAQEVNYRYNKKFNPS